MSLTPWSYGYLDIHHINTHRGDAGFFIFPDGTTLLFDAGDINSEKILRECYPLKIPPLPPNSPSPGTKIVNYIRWAKPGIGALDYAVVSHFHEDHYGCVMEDSPMSSSGKYKLTGITEVDELLGIHTLFDRDYPNYDFPLNLDQSLAHKPSFKNYRNFIAERGSRNTLSVKALVPGSANQIVLKSRPETYPCFQIRNLKRNGDIWTGEGDGVKTLFGPKEILNMKQKWDENLLSMALKLDYGNFTYYTGGDLTGLQAPGVPTWYDAATPVGAGTGPVDVMTLNHHGNRDGSNEHFEKLLQPRVIVQQSWCSDHPGQELIYRMMSPALYPGPRDIFATYIHEETKVTFGRPFLAAYRSMAGHIVVRVHPGGREYFVHVLEDSVFPPIVKETFGPYNSKRNM